MAHSRQHRSAAGGPAGWVVLLGLMVLALVIAAASKGCGDDTTDVAGPGGGTPTQTATTTTTGPASGQAVVDQINAAVQTAGGIQFVTASADLTAESRGALDAVAAILARNQDVKVEVGGHTDTQGEPDKNLELSQQRADAVVSYLTSKGIAQTRLTARGYGETAPLVANDTTEDARRRNRRVEFKLAP